MGNKTSTKIKDDKCVWRIKKTQLKGYEEYEKFPIISK